MAQAPPSIPYRFIYDLLVEYVSGRSDDDRFLWLENGDLKPLVPYLTARQPGTLFARELLVAAYLHRDANDDSLRQLLILLRDTHSGHIDTFAILDNLLEHPDLRPLLFPAGLPDTDDPTLLRARARFRQMPTNPDTPLPDVAPLPPPYHMRLDRNTDFVGREMELKEIARAIKDGRGAVVAAGIGGVGKTQTAIEWVHRYGQFFAGGVFWLDFQDAETARLSIATAGIAYGWDLYNALDLDTQIARVRNQWNESIPTLLVFDNCEEITLAYEYLPVGSGAKVILTSRNNTWQAQVGNRGILQMEIVTLPRVDSIALLQGLSPSLNTTHAGEIAEVVGDLPLALHLAGSYLAKYKGTSFGEPVTYLDALKTNVVHQLESSAIRLKSRPSPTDHTLSIRATFALSWQRLQRRVDTVSPITEEVIGLVAQFAPGIGVPLTWLWGRLQNESSQQDDIVDAIEELQLSGLIELPQKGEVKLHRLISEIVREQMELSEVFEAGIKVDKSLIDHTPIFGHSSFVTNMEQWLPHARYRAEQATLRDDELTARLLSKLGVSLNYLVLYPEAIFYTTKALEIRRQVLGLRHPETARSLNNLGVLYDKQGDYAKALVLYEKSLEIWRDVLGDHHPDTALSLNNLAVLYRSQGEYDKALPLYKEALAIRKEVLGPRHPVTASSLNNLAVLYHHLGKYFQAFHLYEEALAIQKEVLGPRHPDTARSLNNLGYLYQKQENYERALQLFEEALDIRKEVLGLRHPGTALCLNNLAYLYQMKGEYIKALVLYEEALATEKEVLGSRHPDTTHTLNNLGYLYQVQGDYDRALPLIEEALDIRREVLRPNHPDISYSLINLANIFQEQGKYEKAFPLYMEALDIRKEVLGPNHPDTAQSYNCLGYLYQLQKDYISAVPFYEAAIKILIQAVGPHHDMTITVEGNRDWCIHALESQMLDKDDDIVSPYFLGKKNPDN